MTSDPEQDAREIAAGLRSLVSAARRNGYFEIAEMIDDVVLYSEQTAAREARLLRDDIEDLFTD